METGQNNRTINLCAHVDENGNRCKGRTIHKYCYKHYQALKASLSKPNPQLIARQKVEAEKKVRAMLFEAWRNGATPEGAEVVKDEAPDPQVVIKYQGTSYTFVDDARVKANAARQQEARKAAIEARKRAAAANRVSKPKTEKRSKSR